MFSLPPKRWRFGVTGPPGARGCRLLAPHTDTARRLAWSYINLNRSPLSFCACKRPSPSPQALTFPSYCQFPQIGPHIHQGLVLQLSLIPPAPRVGSAPLPGWALGDAKHKYPQCDFWQRWSFWLQIYHQDLSLRLAAFPYPCSHKTSKCSDMILGYPQNSPPAIQESDSIFYKVRPHFAC